MQSGFCANQAAISPLVGRDRATGEQDAIFSDRLNHASIIDGARLSRAKIIVYEHCDAADLEAKIHDYLEAGVRLIWVLYPGTRTVTEYCSPGEIKTIEAHQSLQGRDVLPGFTCKVASLFPSA